MFEGPRTYGVMKAKREAIAVYSATLLQSFRSSRSVLSQLFEIDQFGRNKRS
jgi:hypothetical protein